VHGRLTWTVAVFSKKFERKGCFSKRSGGSHVSPILGKVLKACPCAVKAIVTSGNIPGRVVEGCTVSCSIVQIDIV
jgi:hypothetical protein